jgi:hypothetical protein
MKRHGRHIDSDMQRHRRHIDSDGFDDTAAEKPLMIRRDGRPCGLVIPVTVRTKRLTASLIATSTALRQALD